MQRNRYNCVNLSNNNKSSEQGVKTIITGQKQKLYNDAASPEDSRTNSKNHKLSLIFSLTRWNLN